MKDVVLLELANRWELEAKAPDCEDGSEAAEVSNAAGHAHRQALRACADNLRSLVGMLGDPAGGINAWSVTGRAKDMTKW